MNRIIITLIFLLSSIVYSNNYWTEVSPANITLTGERNVNASEYKAYSLQLQAFTQALANTPHERVVSLRNSTIIINIPMPEGRFERFRIVGYSIMAPELAAKYPGIKTFIGEGADNLQLTARFDITSWGFHGMVFSPDGMVMIDPLTRGTTDYYGVYFRKNSLRPFNVFGCEVLDIGVKKKLQTQTDSQGEQLRTYRLALACTGEYATRFGGTVAGVHNEFIVAMNRINGVYEKDVAARMVIVANNDTLIFLNAATDPYTNNNGGAMLNQNQVTCDNYIGSANYDIGHVFSTGGGGIAFLGVTCVNGSKAGGVTGLGNPIGDPFYIDYVAHEMGHQFGANHTFNCVTGSCGGGNRVGATAYEPGSASTIMGYAGICNPNNLQNNSDAYFHAISILEIRNNIQNDPCPVLTATGNGDPVVTVPAGGFSIPKSTPFALTGSATDPNSDSIFYCWEQWDLGPAGSWNAPVGDAPIFRSFNSVVSGTRTFPKLSSLLNNTTTIGEILPSYGRNLNFRLVARDNKPGGGGVGTADIAFLVDGNSGPFLVTYPNLADTINGQQTVTWDVANTNNTPVNCSNVNILLSTDGGNTWPTTLSANTPNDGSEAVTLPTIDAPQCRIKVESVGNIFFDISNQNFMIAINIGIQQYTSTPVEFKLEQNFPNPFNPVTMINFGIPKKSAVTLVIYDVTGKIVSTLINNEIKTEGSYGYEFDAANLPSGIYFYKLTAGEFTESKKMILVK